MSRKIDKDLQEALTRIEGKKLIRVDLEETRTGDNFVTFVTEDTVVKMGANDLGFWLIPHSNEGETNIETNDDI